MIFWKKPVLDLRGRLGHAPITYTASMVAQDLKEHSSYGERCRLFHRWQKRAVTESLRK